MATEQPSAIEIAKTLHKIPVLLSTWTRCGRAGCRCALEQRHGPYYALAWRDGRTQHRRYVPEAEAAAIATVLGDRRTAKARERAEFAAARQHWHRLQATAAAIEALVSERVEGTI